MSAFETTVKPIALVNPHHCNSCGKNHPTIPAESEITRDSVRYDVAYWWNCECGSTMFEAFGRKPAKEFQPESEACLEKKAAA